MRQIKKGRVLKSFTLPESIAISLEELAKEYEVLQGDIVKVAVLMLEDMPSEDVIKELRKWGIY